jgi:tRNA pseudouridine38-40 synthase
VKGILEYDGTAYAGFQRQKQLPTIQGALEAAIEAATKESTRVTAAGRTDSGAHATGQVVSFAVSTRLDDRTLLRAVNAHLPADIALQELSTVDASFDPRRQAVRRQYHYLVLSRVTPSPLWRGRALQVRLPLDLDAMRAAGRHFIGVHDFSAFGSPSRVGGSRVREIFCIDIETEGDLVRIRIAGGGFMLHMIRSMVGMLLQVGEGRRQPDDVRSVLASRDPARSGPLAPACGLYLVEVSYPAEDQAEPSSPSHGRGHVIANHFRSTRVKELSDA